MSCAALLCSDPQTSGQLASPEMMEDVDNSKKKKSQKLTKNSWSIKKNKTKKKHEAAANVEQSFTVSQKNGFCCCPKSTAV